MQMHNLREQNVYNYCTMPRVAVLGNRFNKFLSFVYIKCHCESWVVLRLNATMLSDFMTIYLSCFGKEMNRRP